MVGRSGSRKTARAPRAKNETRQVVMLVYPEVFAMDVFGPLEAFAMANFCAERPLYRLAVASMDGEPVDTSIGVKLHPSVAVAGIKGPIDTLLVSGGHGPIQASGDSELVGWLKAQGAKARRTGSICTGAFVLAAAGLLDGKRATTHWALADELGRRHPKLTIDVDRIFVREGGVYTSAGVTAGIDLALALIEEDHGRKLALRVARALVVYLQREGGQTQFSNRLQAQFTENRPIRRAQAWAMENLAADLSAAALAVHAGMSERTFRRTFAAETNETPRDFVERVRVDAARQMIETDGLPLQTVARRCGLETAATLRRAFVRRLGITPQRYRDRF
jgi:transcriptional regulator GlxA family with amidase domain